MLELSANSDNIASYVNAAPGQTQRRQLMASAVSEERELLQDMHEPQRMGLERVTATHHVSEKATLAKTLEELTKDPLVRRFLRKKPKLYLMLPDQKDVLKPVFDNQNMSEFKSHIAVGYEPFILFSEREMRVCLAHELSHTLRGDSHMKRDIEPTLACIMEVGGLPLSYHERDYERLADKLALYLTRDNRAMRSGLTKLCDAILATQQAENPKKDLSEEHLEIRTDLELRLNLLDEAARTMAQPGGRNALRNELADAYLAEHKRLFPGQFTRQLSNTREHPVHMSFAQMAGHRHGR